MNRETLEEIKQKFNAILVEYQNEEDFNCLIVLSSNELRVEATSIQGGREGLILGLASEMKYNPDLRGIIFQADAIYLNSLSVKRQ